MAETRARENQRIGNWRAGVTATAAEKGPHSGDEGGRIVETRGSNVVVTASMLYNLIQCPHRLSLDLHEDPAKKDPESKFVELLWEKGTLFEDNVINELKVPFAELSGLSGAERERQTREAMARKVPLIHGGRIRADDLLGEPDILRWDDAMGYVAGDIKSGSGEEMEPDDEEGKPKKHYAVQLALYTDILERLGASRGRRPFIWDVHREEVTYVLDAPQGVRTPQTLWELYKDTLDRARAIVSRPDVTLPALAPTCKLCHWRSLCKAHVRRVDDLTLIAELGRSKRDLIAPFISTVTELATCDLSHFVQGSKTAIKGVGISSLRKFQARARLLCDRGSHPYCTMAPPLPTHRKELFFDIEVDPMRDICYLHGFLERTNRDCSSERFIPFVAETPTIEEEERAFRDAWDYVKSSLPCALYFYSKYERTWWRKLRKRYPHVATDEEIEAMFDPAHAVDLYFDVVKKYTEWPTNDQSIKTLASFLGFHWRDTSPSGADSIEWYHRWIESGDPAIRQRILDYNEDDCIATQVLADGIRGLSVV
jgi:predicted RecB family nuclease